MWIYFLGHIMQPIPLNKDFLLNEKKNFPLKKLNDSKRFLILLVMFMKLHRLLSVRAFFISSMNLCR